MSVRVCYIERALRGEAITGLRLVSERAEESWVSPGPPDDSAPQRDVAAAAAWIAQKAAGSPIDVLCLDADGSLCSWISSASEDPEVVGFLARQSHSDTAPETPIVAHAALSDYADTPEGASVLVLGTRTQAPATKGKAAAQIRPKRLPVMAVNDVPARLLIDALDGRGVIVKTATTIHQALAAVWDPSAKHAANTAPADVAAESAPVTAIIALDPSCGRLHWVWSRSGVLLAGESSRLPAESTDAAGGSGTLASRTHVQVPTGRFRLHPRAADASRVVTSWLSWAAELGVSPSRVRILTPDEPAATNVSQFGQALAKAFNGAVVDLTAEPDPVGVTLTRLAERVDDVPANTPVASAVGILDGPTQRPTRANRRAYVLMALGVTAVAAAIGAFAYRLRVEAGQASTAAINVENTWRKDVESVDATLLQTPEMVPDKLNTKLTKLRAENRPKASRADVKPVLDELATLTMVAGDPEIHLVEISLAPSFVTLKVHANLEQATALEAALREISGSQLTNWSSNPGRQVGDLYEYTLRATWITPPEASGGPK